MLVESRAQELLRCVYGAYPVRIGRDYCASRPRVAGWCGQLKSLPVVVGSPLGRPTASKAVGQEEGPPLYKTCTPHVRDMYKPCIRLALPWGGIPTPKRLADGLPWEAQGAFNNRSRRRAVGAFVAEGIHIRADCTSAATIPWLLERALWEAAVILLTPEVVPSVAKALARGELGCRLPGDCGQCTSFQGVRVASSWYGLPDRYTSINLPFRSARSFCPAPSARARACSAVSTASR
jgi:hypothetical protein